MATKSSFTARENMTLSLQTVKEEHVLSKLETEKKSLTPLLYSKSTQITDPTSWEHLQKNQICARVADYFYQRSQSRVYCIYITQSSKRGHGLCW